MARGDGGSEVVLVTGGAGYIGSHAVLALREAGIGCVVLDDLSTGSRAAVPPDVPFVQANIADAESVCRTMRDYGVTAVMHFAASLVVPESVTNPLLYYANNVTGSLALVRACVVTGVRRFVFSSTAAVYGEPDIVPIPETAPTRPLNPYGQSKLMVERVLRDAAAAHDLDVAILRYFNVAGADPVGRAGQRTRDATHLIKVACETALGRRPALHVFGTDYPTPDGTCIRDFIHVSDLADAHVLALRHLSRQPGVMLYNCGYGRGYSVREVIAAVERATARRLPIRFADRRPGDAAIVVADASALRADLGWMPRYADIDSIVETALAWEGHLQPEAA